jgi:hypothetical protein
MGLRGTAGEVLEEIPYAIRNVLFYFFLLFVLRVLLRGQWRAALAFAGFFAALSALGNDRPWVGGLIGFLYFGSGAVAVLRWGLVSFVSAIFVSSLLFNVVVTLDASAWYVGNNLLLIAMVAGLATWALYVSLAGRLWKVETA